MGEITFFPKIARLSREVVITEKLDGTNAGVGIIDIDNTEGGLEAVPNGGAWQMEAPDDGRPLAMFALSKNRVLAPASLSGKKDSDNFGFASWVFENRHELVKLGPGTHFGEWWGRGIQRGYGLDHKRFSLFNAGRWASAANASTMPAAPDHPPACCHVVPVLCGGAFDTQMVDYMMALLRANGSTAAPGFMNPEGIIVYHTAAKTMFKKTFEKDAAGKEAA